MSIVLEFEAATPPVQGMTRVKRKFAWFPKKIGGSILWLGKYEILEAYIVTDYKVILDGHWSGVSVGKWVEVSRRISE